jgi:hypothetical protein
MSRLAYYFLITLFLIRGAGNDPFLSARTQPPSPGTTPGQAQGTTPETRGAWLARKVEDRETGKDARLAIRMRLFDRHDRVSERRLTLLSLRGGAGRPVPGDRTLLRFTYPNDIKGTGFLVWEQPNADDERFLYLPSLGRVRRIASGEAQESFVGSDLTFEDIGGRELEDYSYTLLDGPDVAQEWAGADGVKHAVYTLESRNKDAAARFPRVVSQVRKDNFVVVHAVIYNRRNEAQKTFDVLRLEQVKGYWTALELRMSDALQHTRTELVLDSVEYDVGLTPDAFTRRELEKSGGT